MPSESVCEFIAKNGAEWMKSGTQASSGPLARLRLAVKQLNHDRVTFNPQPKAQALLRRHDGSTPAPSAAG